VLLVAEEAAPAWVPALAFLVPILIMAAVGTWAFKLRRRSSRTRRAQEKRIPSDATELGSAATIEDPSAYSLDAVLKAMAIQPEDHGPTADGMPHDEGWAGTMLGLRSRMSSSSQVLEPHVFWGKRAAGQVFIRIGPDERLEGGTTMFSNRHIRDITVLRVAAPVFDITVERGALKASGPGVGEVSGLLSGLAADEATWGDMRAAGGPEGIVVSRNAIDGTMGGWPYDLWLCEWLAASLRLPPLEDARIGPSWTVPYGFGKALEPEDRSAGKP
jgi:hypothetical protein